MTVADPTPLLLLLSLPLPLPLHGGAGAPPTPVPHWAVLLTVVPGLWLLIGGGAVALDRLLGRVADEE